MHHRVGEREEGKGVLMNDLMTYDDGELTVFCRKCGHAETIKVSEKIYMEILEHKKAIQNIIPDVPAAIREMFTSGYCDVCFKLSTSCLSDETCHEILDFMKDKGIISPESHKEIDEASALYLDLQDLFIEILTEMEWQDDGDTVKKTGLLREKILSYFRE